MCRLETRCRNWDRYLDALMRGSNKVTDKVSDEVVDSVTFHFMNTAIKNMSIRYSKVKEMRKNAYRPFIRS